MRAIILIFAAAALGPTGVGGCAEQPQSLASAGQPGFKTDSWDEQHRERTLRQGESRRIYH